MPARRAKHMAAERALNEKRRDGVRSLPMELDCLRPPGVEETLLSRAVVVRTDRR